MDTAQTADYALQVLLRLEGSEGRTVGELSADLGVSPSAMRRIVATLHRRVLVTRLRSGGYVLGPGLIGLGGNLTHELAAVARPLLREIAEETGEMVVLMVPDGEEGEVVARWSGTTGPLRVEYAIGARQPLSRGAGGLALLAFDEAPLPVLTPAQIAAVARCRDRGYARTGGEVRPNIEDIAVPVRDERLGVLASLAIVVPSARAENLTRLLPGLQRAADGIAEEYLAASSGWAATS